MIPRTAVEGSPPHFVLQTIDDPRLERRSADGHHTTLLGPGKPFALLLYLALAPRQTASRTLLLDLLWSNAEPYRARATLRQTLSTLRDVLGHDAIQSRSDEVILRREIDVDTRAFMLAVRERRFEDAIACYARPFLAGFSVAGGDGFEEWVTLERRRLNDAYLLAVESLARARLDRGRPRDALPLARQLREADPLRQDAWCLLIEVLLSTGNLLDARLEVDALEHLLEAEDCEPEAATRTVVGRVRRLTTGQSTPDAVPSDDAIGREQEFATLMGLWATATAGTARLITLIGPARRGKTRLLADAARRLRAKGALVLMVRTLRKERRVPYALAATIAEHLAAAPGAMAVSEDSARRLVTLAPRLSTTFTAAPDAVAADDDDGQHAADALLELIRAVADEQPLALLIDDLHQADSQSQQVLRSVADRLERDRVLLIAALRPGRSAPLDGPGATLLELRPWSGQRGDAVQRSSGHHARLWTAMVAAGVVCACGVVLRPRPARLMLAVAPLVGNDGVGLVPAPVVEVEDQYGRLMTSASETVRVQVAAGQATLRGTTSVVVRNGRASFKDVTMLGGADTTTLEFSAAGLVPAHVVLLGSHANVGLFLVRAVLDGQVLSPSARTLHVGSGDSIVGTATLRYSSNWAASSVMLGMIPTWGDRRTNFVTVSPLVTPAQGLVRHVDVQLAAPRSPGCYHIILAFQAEGNVAEIASGTNWTVGHPMWYHGYDVVAWTDDQLATADSAGVVMSGYLRRVNGRIVRGDHGVGATVIDVAVDRAGQSAPGCTGDARNHARARHAPSLWMPAAQLREH